MSVGREFDENDRRRHSETDGVAQAVELGAELTGLFRPPRGPAVEHVEHHRQKDQEGGNQQALSVGAAPPHTLGKPDLGGKSNRAEAANGIAQREHRRQNGKHLLTPGYPKAFHVGTIARWK